ncbi:hypothetical protein CYMTET_47708 [Cymbomonas tetramitiformis]|uniref:Uncharacterized protein n=1 Tax=Cymbomonas tetramitiformis TaxID=36881 RepID=A0AAE0BUY6_9CHLO|nr:hypothetical protein CYMTET_47708 [Cymbomonas tetramitiformis]
MENTVRPRLRVRFECFMSRVPEENAFPVEVSRTLCFLRNDRLRAVFFDEESVKRALFETSRSSEEPLGVFEGFSKWWRGVGSLRMATEFHERIVKEHLEADCRDARDEACIGRFAQLLPALVGHDTVGVDAGQAKMYAVISWTRLLCYAAVPFPCRSEHSARLGVRDCTHIPSPSKALDLRMKDTPTQFFHTARQEACPIHMLLLDFDLPKLEDARYHLEFVRKPEHGNGVVGKEACESEAAWRSVRSESGPVWRACRAIEAAWPRWFPGCSAHILLFETRRDVDAFAREDPGKPSVHGYVFQRFTDCHESAETSRVWPFHGPVFQDKRAYIAFFKEFLHPLIQADEWFAQRGIRAESFLDPVCGPTVRAVGMAKWESKAASSICPRYSHTAVPMSISDPLAVRAYVSDRAFALGRMLGLLTDVPIATITHGEDGHVCGPSGLSEFLKRVVSKWGSDGAAFGSIRTMPPSTRAITKQSPPELALKAMPILLRILACVLQGLGAEANEVARIELDQDKLQVLMFSKSEESGCRALVIAKQCAGCFFCPIRDFDINRTPRLRTRGSEIPLRILGDRKRTSPHTSGGDKMSFMFKIDTNNDQRDKNVLSHMCMKCYGQGLSDKKKRILGTIPRRAAMALGDLLQGVALACD